jgi:hypothetical protein
MSRGPQTFRQADLTRALKAARAAGVKVRIRIAKDGMVIEMTDGEITTGKNEWDEVHDGAAPAS